MGKGKVIQFKSRENSKGEDYIEDIKQFEEYKEEVYKKMEEYKLVARNHIEARMLSELIMEKDESVHYCKFDTCKSRIGEFVEVVPVFRDNSGKQPMYVRKEISSSYIMKLQDEGILFEGPGGMLFITDNHED